MYPDTPKSYTNGEITVYWKPYLCCHSGVCIRRLPRVFSLSRRPWIDLSLEDTQRIIETVDECPSGALSYNYNAVSI